MFGLGGKVLSGSNLRLSLKSISYKDTVLAHSPIMYWRLGESTGTTIVDEIGNQNGTFIGTPTFGVNGAIVNDGDTAISTSLENYGNVGLIPEIDFDVPFSIDLWVKHTDTGGLAYISNFAASQGFQLGQDASDYIECYMFNSFGTIGMYIHTTVSINDGNWHHLVFTYDGSQDTTGVDVYVDGASIAFTDSVNNLTGTWTTGNAYLLGRHGAGFAGYELIGALDEVAIYSRVLSATEVANLYAVATRSTYKDTVLAYSR